MKKIIPFYIAVVFIFSTNCNNHGNSANNSSTNINAPTSHQKTPEELRSELKQIENNSPENYLTIKNATISDSMLLVVKPSFFNHSKYAKVGNIIRGMIRNNASIAKYKDVVITVSYYSKTETLIGSKDYTLYEYYEPHSNNQFSLHVYPPDGWSQFSVNIRTATGVQ